METERIKKKKTEGKSERGGKSIHRRVVKTRERYKMRPKGKVEKD